MAESITREEDEDEEGVEREQRVRVTFNEEKQLIMEGSENISRKEKRKAMKKSKRKQMRKEIAMKQREEEEAKLSDLEEQRKIELEEREEAERRERERKEFEDRERAWIEAMEKKRKEQEEEEVRRKALEESKRQQEVDNGDGPKDDDDDNWEYIEEGPAEIIWQGNEIIVKKKRVRVPKKDLELQQLKDDTDRPTSNPLPPQSEAFAEYTNPLMVSAQQILENVSQQVPNFGTEQDKAHCPFHLKTGTCRFGQRCSRVHFYPDKSCTLLIRNMYNGPGIAWEQDEGLEHTDEEVERCYEEFYEDVHTEFLKFGEIVNFKVCRNGSFHLRGNVYIQYKSLDSAVLACHSVNGRFFAGKQVKCEYVNVTRWKVAICGEYMKSRYKICSHGTACNFIHCFRNPGADYEWADWDKPPPRYWVKKMAALFGYPEEHGFEEQNVRENSGPFRNSVRTMDIKSRRKHLRRSESMGWDMSTGGNYHKTPDGYGIDASSGDDEQRIRRHDDRLSEEKSNPQKSRYCHTHRRTNRYEAEEDRAPRDRDRHRSRTRESSSKRQKVSEEQESHGFTRKAHERDSGGDQSGSDTDKRKHRRYSSRRSSKHSEKEERADGWGRSWHSDSSEEWSDMDRDADNYYGSRRRGSDRRRESKSGRNQTINLQDRWDPE